MNAIAGIAAPTACPVCRSPRPVAFAEVDERVYWACETCQARYDFITCTETAEHFHHPAREFDRLDGLLRPGGWLGVMTRFQTDDRRFAEWHYRRDPTHVVFYCKATMRMIAAQRRWTCDIPAKDIALMHKPATGPGRQAPRE